MRFARCLARGGPCGWPAGSQEGAHQRQAPPFLEADDVFRDGKVGIGDQHSSQPWLDRQWAKVVRALDHLDGDLPRLGKNADAGQIALRATLGYLSLRFPGEWEKGHARLRRWAERFDERFPELKALLPG